MADTDDSTDAFDPVGDPVIDRLDFPAEEVTLDERLLGLLEGSVATVSEMEVADDDSDAAEDDRERSPCDDLDVFDFADTEAPSRLDGLEFLGFTTSDAAAFAAVDCCFCCLGISVSTVSLSDVALLSSSSPVLSSSSANWELEDSD